MFLFLKEPSIMTNWILFRFSVESVHVFHIFIISKKLLKRIFIDLQEDTVAGI